MLNWKISGIIATLIIIISLPVYTLKEIDRQNISEEAPAVTFVGSEVCSQCHRHEYEEWQQSHHAKAMAVASEKTVLGDFNNKTFISNGIESRFYKKGPEFFVYTRGASGKMEEFKITHTFGWSPLQQYLIPFPGGRMQCLPIAWDDKDKKWFHLYPDLELEPAEWIYWTNQGQNWNSMCADCHSTGLQKNYDPLANSYDTKWKEINVGCEACHGPGSEHIAWTKIPEMARINGDDGLVVKTSGINGKQQVELCAPCHSRRSMLGDYTHLQQNLLNTELPRLLDDGLYYSDGQILDEVYVYGSFVQSKMYANNVQCSDCHNPHTIKLQQKGNELCLQCHQASLYDTKEHHFHKKEGVDGKAILNNSGEILFAVGSGADCVQCHMPGRTYMGNDYRPDHSIRVPRPDLSVELGTPNACNRCHVDKTNEWSAEYTTKWYGSNKKYHYGSTFNSARAGKPLDRTELISIVSDNLASTLVRATALSLLAAYPGNETTIIFRQIMESDKAILRRTALISLSHFSLEEQIQLAAPLLGDPVKGVRIEAARVLTRIPADQLDKRWQESFTLALEEFKNTLLYLADFADSRLNLGALAIYAGKLNEAEEHFKKAVAIDRNFYAAHMNLAVLYSGQGENDLAENQLRQALDVNSDLADVNYSLGLLLSEQKQYKEAIKYLAKAAAGMPDNARVHYNLGQLLLFLGQDKEAEKALRQTIGIDPKNMNYLQVMAQFYYKRGQYDLARDIVKRMITVTPEHQMSQQMLQHLNTIIK